MDDTQLLELHIITEKNEMTHLYDKVGSLLQQSFQHMGGPNEIHEQFLRDAYLDDDSNRDSELFEFPGPHDDAS